MLIRIAEEFNAATWLITISMLPTYTVTTTVYTCCGDGGVCGEGDGGKLGDREPPLSSLLPDGDGDGGGEGRTSKAVITLMAAVTIELLFAQLSAEVIAARSCVMLPMFVPR